MILGVFFLNSDYFSRIAHKNAKEWILFYHFELWKFLERKKICMFGYLHLKTDTVFI